MNDMFIAAPRAAEAAGSAAVATQESLFAGPLGMGIANLERAEHRRNHLDEIEAALSR